MTGTEPLYPLQGPCLGCGSLTYPQYRQLCWKYRSGGNAPSRHISSHRGTSHEAGEHSWGNPTGTPHLTPVFSSSNPPEQRVRSHRRQRAVF